MLFEIDFNREDRDEDLEKIGAFKPSPDDWYHLEVENFEALQALEKKVYEVTGEYYSLIVGFDNPTIYLDKNV